VAWAERDGVRIWFEVEGAGPPVLLLHGGAASGEAWRRLGYVDALRDEYRLILIDARGHGRSDRSDDYRTYRPAGHAADTVAVLDELGLEAAAAMGFSMGGSTALAMAGLYPDRIVAVVSLDAGGGPVGFADHRPPVTDEDWALVETVERDGMRPFVELLEHEGRPEWAAMFARMDARAFALQTRAWADPEELGIRLRDIAVPLLFFFGERKDEPDPVVPPHATVIVLPNTDHAGVMEAIDMVVPAAREHLRLAFERRRHSSPHRTKGAD
jgi:pimeloyl-ACP methyl ester carboxylesterase